MGPATVMIAVSATISVMMAVSATISVMMAVSATISVMIAVQEIDHYSASHLSSTPTVVQEN
jgi:hypothetical protein